VTWHSWGSIGSMSVLECITPAISSKGFRGPIVVVVIGYLNAADARWPPLSLLALVAIVDSGKGFRGPM
jgi:hypothetical protein